MKIVIVSASTRHGRLTHHVALGLYNSLQTKGEGGVQILDLKETALPHFEEAMSKQTHPSEIVNQVYSILNEADAFLFVTPEYNGSYSSALKNMVDFFPKVTFAKKAIGIVTVSSGQMGGMRAAIQLQQLALALWAIPSPQMLLISNVQEKFAENGNLLDPSLEKTISHFLSEFLWLGKALKNAQTPTL
jgi:NAD(P)H-dependent FMN reductase